MIVFAKKDEPKPVPAKAEDNRFDQIRKAAERTRVADTDGTRRRARQTADDNKLL